MTTTTLATIHSAGRTMVTLTRDDRRSELLGVAIGNEFGPSITTWLDPARVGALIAALQRVHQQQAGR